MDTELRRVVKRKSYNAYSKARLVDPVDSGFILIGVQVDKRPPFFPASRSRRALIAECKQTCNTIAQQPTVASAVTFTALFVPPGKGAFLKAHPEVHSAKFDVVVLIETNSVTSAHNLRKDDIFLALEKRMTDASRHAYTVTARNVRRIGPVNHDRQGVFLFNYFFADDVDQNLATWDYTAGWFERETGLDNSTVLLPLENEHSTYTILNHCRWDRLVDIIPSLLFKRSFRDYVEANFDANHVAPIPVLYRKA